MIGRASVDYGTEIPTKDLFEEWRLRILGKYSDGALWTGRTP